MLQIRTRAGELDRELLIQEKIISRGDSNEDYEDGWQNIATDPIVRCKVMQFRGNEAMIAERLTETRFVIFRIRYRTDIKAKGMRGIFESQLYKFVSIHEPEGRRRFLDITAELLDTDET